MAKIKDLTGQMFGHLTVLEIAGKLNGKTAWKCRCDCGNEVVALSVSLTGGKKISCGCQRFQGSTKLIKDLTNQRFGHLVALYRVESKPGMWHVKCDCGVEKDVRTQDLTSGNTKSCGGSVHRIKDITGQKFGKLTALRPTGRSTNERSMIWLCRCDCGNEVEADAKSLTRGNTTSCGCRTSSQTDLKGKQFGKLTVQYTLDRKMNYDTVWHCRCNCGKEIDITARSILTSRNPSCGCALIKLDVTGQKFGYLTALYPTDKRQSAHVVWHCRCDCGNERDVVISALTKGTIVSCGCKNKNRATDLSGERFGKLLVLEPTEKKGKELYYKCQCDCGKLIETSRHNHVTGGTRSCGCSRSRDFRGEKRGKLTALYPTGRTKNKYPIYVWRCDCGNEIERSVAEVTGRHSPDFPVGVTPWDKTITYVTKIVITKVITGSTTPLEGAVFQITGTTLNKVIIEGEVFTVDDNANPAYYKLKDGSYTTTESTAATADLYVAGLQKYKKEAKKTISAEPGQTVIYEGVSDSTGKVSFTGLPAGDYVITEIAAPAGYNKIEGTINVHIDWTKPTKADNPGIDDVTDTCTWEYTTTGHLKNAKAEATDGIIKYTVENSAGATLPSTGGIGTTIFYVAGSILVLAAAILLITKRRMGAND